MRTIEIKAYSFAELSEDAKENAISNYPEGFLTEWWENVLYDAENVFIKITGFDTDRGNYCSIQFVHHSTDTAEKIISEHGKSCDTYQAAKEFLKEYYSHEVQNVECCEIMPGEDFACEKEFKRSLSECYLQILRNEFDYLTSEEYIAEFFAANGYEFNESGEML